MIININSVRWKTFFGFNLKIMFSRNCLEIQELGQRNSFFCFELNKINF